MALSLVPLQDSITSRVKATLPNHDVFEDMLPDEVMPRRDTSGQMIPYVILRYGPLRKSYSGGNAVAGVRHDDYFGTVDVMGIGPTGRMARQTFDVLTDCLVGYEPGGGGAIHLEGSSNFFVVSSNEARPTQMVCMIRLKFQVNGENVAAPMTP